MKKIIFIMASLMYFFTTQAQYKNVEKLPQKLRDSILIDVANKAINKYSEGYLRAGAIPIIEDLGLLKKEFFGVGKEYLNTYFFSVYYKGTEEEQNYFHKDYLVKVYIRADNCRPVNIRYICDWITKTRLDHDEAMNSECEHKMRFISMEEIEEKKKNSARTIIIDTPSEYWRKFDERAKHRRDSVMKEIQKNIEIKRKAMEEQQKADSLKSR